MTKAITPDQDAVTKSLADEYAPVTPEAVECLRCGGPVEANGLGLKVFKHSEELGAICHDCTWDGNGHAILNEDELEGWLHSIG
jgi:hypothetical protein